MVRDLFLSFFFFSFFSNRSSFWFLYFYLVPTTVGPGYYTLGGNETDNRTRTYQKLVERGFFAEAGRKLRCPPGYYGDVQGLSTERCSGFCPAANYCPWATATPQPCEDGYYSSGGTFYCMKCPRPEGSETKDTCKTGRHCCFM